MLTIKEMEEQTGLSSYTLRYYEKERIIIPRRLSNGRRAYSAEDLDWILFVKQLRELNVPIEAICEYAEYIRQGDLGLEKRTVFLQTYREKIKEQAKILQTVEKVIAKQMQIVSNEKKRVQKEQRKK